ncbi:hypothetical protein D9Q98_003716 [Chlorella vulgaris]|uniref:MYND-type domain-containing protein n=1 Tax=Chlorella vulgaris TaxID=3077 RepID=A0A9D4TTM2_CHLVU|nr:hypothetical protein D9Q98_003716 [Chlorella vulgaris]
MLQPLLQAVAQLPAVLRVLMDFFQAQLAAGADLALGREWKAGMLKDCNNSVLLLSRLACLAPESAAHNSVAAATGAYSAASSLTEMVAWCTASSALLGALPHVAALEARSQLEHQAGAGQPSTAVARNLIHVSSNGTLAVLRFCCGMRSGGRWSASEVEAAYNALWQLHTTMCRSIHTSLQFESIQEVKMLGSLLNCVECVVHVRAAVQGQQLNPPAGPRHLLAMSVAQAEAVLATADAGPAALKDESVAALVLLKALEHGPPALASFAPVQQAMERLLARVEALGVSGSADPAVLELSGMQEQSQRMQREPQPGDALELAQAAAIRSCAYLRCANLAGEGGPAARQGAGSQRCSKCRVAWYCGTACSHADWRAGHRRVCRALRGARVAAREQQREGVEV